MSPTAARILIVDDEEIVLRSCKRILGEAGFTVETATDGRDALGRTAQGGIDLVVLDIMMPHMDGLEVLRRLKESQPDIEVIMVTGLSRIDTAVRAMKLGAFDYLPKPFDPEELKRMVACALERQAVLRERPAGDAEARYGFESIIGSAPAMQAVYRLVARCAPTAVTVLVTGESGTGKELIARAIHHNSLRRDGPFVAVDCTTLSENLFESEMFGHVKGAFTGAVANKRGLLELAAGGTLFLDEIGNVPLAIQAKLLRAIQEREFKAVGDTRTHAVDVRLVCATLRDLKAMVADGTFREDLYYRINIFPIQLPPLRERREDIPALARHFLKACTDGASPAEFSADALAALVHHDWPGNVRELENAVQRAAILAGGRTIRLADLAGSVGCAQGDESDVPRTGEELKHLKKAAREKSVESIERAFIEEALKRNDWNVTRSAEATGMQRANFQALMKKHNIRLRALEARPGGESGESS